MLRNLIAVIAGVLLSFVLTVAGLRLTWLLIVGNVDSAENKHAIVRVMLWQSLFIIPAVCVVVAGFVASIVTRSHWWLGGVATLPLLIYGLIRGVDRIDIFLSIVYIGLAFSAALIVSRFKRRHLMTHSPHAR